MLKFVKFILLTAWMVLIFTTSQIAFAPVSHVQAKTFYDYIFDKDVHLILYSVLSFLAASFFYHNQFKFKNIFFASIFTAFVYGIIDEYHQTFVVDREASIFDLAFDCLGALFGVGMYWLWSGVKNNFIQIKKYAQYLHRRSG